MEIKPGYYLHFKGHVYLVMCVATHTETNEALVVYGNLERMFVRPLTMFTENVVHEGVEVPRFKFIGGDINDAEAYLRTLPEED